MINKDKLWRGTAYQNQFRVFAVVSTQTIQKARNLHDLSPIATILMGNMISAVALMSLDLKSSGSEISLRIEGDGALKGGIAICSQYGFLRCMAFEPRLLLEDTQANFLPGKQIGSGTLSVYRHLRGKSPMISNVNLTTGEVAEDLTHYYHQSEQINTAINLGILIDKNATIKSGGGILIQQLPDADPKNVDALIQNIQNTPNISDLMDMGLSMEDILKRFYFKGTSVDITPCNALRYKCNCSKKRFSQALKLLGRAELSEMQAGISPYCFFCNRTYHFNTEDISEIIKSLKDNA